MTDEQMDARLRTAGESWRAATDADPGVVAPSDPHSLTQPATPHPRRHRTGLLASAAVVAAALVAGGTVLVANIGGDKHGSSADTVPLESTVWQFVGYGDRLDDRSLSTLYISPDGQLVADDECEVLSARVGSAAGTLDISQLAERFKQCTDTSEPAFSQGIDVLKSTPTYAIDSAGLTIGTGANAMHFVPSADLPAPTLDVPTFTDTDWRLVSAIDQNGNQSAPAGELIFRVEDGRFTADEGCNKLSGEITEQGVQADITSVRSTTLPCPSPQPYELVMQNVIQPGTINAAVNGAELILSRPGGGRLTYQWVPSDANATDPAALIGRDWALASIAGAPASGKVGLYASKTELSVTYGCGAVGGDANVGQGTLHVAGIHDGVAPGCSGDVGDESTTVDSILANDPLWRVADGKLIISDASGAQGFALVFVSPEQPQPTDVPLVGTNWTLIKILDADKHELPEVGDGTLVIGKDGRLTGTAGCNTLGGTAQASGTVLDVGELGGTEELCPGVQNTTEQHIHAVLSGQVDWSIDGNELALTKAGVGTLVYRAGDTTSPPTSTAPSDLVNKVWSLTSIKTGPGSVASTPPGGYSLTITRTWLHLTGKCNWYRAGVDVGTGTLDIGEVSTNFACAADLDVHGLYGSATWQIVGDQLTITTASGRALIFTAGGAAPEPQLVGTVWTLVGIGSTPPGSSGADLPHIVLRFYPHGWNLVAGCSGSAGHTIRDATTMTVTERSAAPSRMHCLTPVGVQIIELIDGTFSWSIQDYTLTLTRDGTTATFTN